MPEAWLDGAVPGIPTPLMPAAHALLEAVHEMDGAASGLDPGELWVRPGGAASIGFHLRHVRGSIRRLLTYARGEALSEEQLTAIPHEAEPGEPPTAADVLLAGVRDAVEEALDVYRRTRPEELDAPRAVGRARLPSTVRGLLFHIADHTRRHAGQVVTTARIVRGLGLG